MSDERRSAEGFPRPINIGLTGGQAAGKSTALRLFGERGALTVSSDEVVGDLYTRPEIIQQVIDRFGDEVAAGGGGLDRTALREMTAGDAAALDWLEELLHPGVGHEIAAKVGRAPGGSVTVAEVPLLFEAGLQDAFDYVVTIEAPPDLRRRRAAQREGSALFEVLDRRQLTTEERKAKADFVYVNDGRPEDMAQFVEEVLETVRR